MAEPLLSLFLILLYSLIHYFNCTAFLLKILSYFDVKYCVTRSGIQLLIIFNNAIHLLIWLFVSLNCDPLLLCCASGCQDGRG